MRRHHYQLAMVLHCWPSGLQTRASSNSYLPDASEGRGCSSSSNSMLAAAATGGVPMCNSPDGVKLGIDHDLVDQQMLLVHTSFYSQGLQHRH